MFEDDEGHDGLPDAVRSILREVSQSLERAVSQVDLDEVANVIGVDLVRVRDFADGAVGWLRAQAEGLGGDDPFPSGGPPAPAVAPDPPSAGPHPLDLPTAEQGRALAAVDSGRLMVGPGRDALSEDGEWAGSRDAPGLVDELRARDWITAGGELTLAGQHALRRWLDAAA